MADPGEDEDYELKDEELVDFEGSDYGFESSEEEGTAAAPEASLLAIKPANTPESGEIEGVKNGYGDRVSVQPPVVVVIDRPPEHKLPPKPDLEDGELDDAAMGSENGCKLPTCMAGSSSCFSSLSFDMSRRPEGSEPEAVTNDQEEDEGENDLRERKRRKNRYSSERQLDNKGRRDAGERALAHSRQFRGRASDDMHGSQRNNYSRDTTGAKSASFNRGNSAVGIMGPGSSPISMEYGGHMSLRFLGRGFPRPIGDVLAPGRLNQNEVNMQNHMRGSMAAQEHIVRHHQRVQMAQEQLQRAHTQAARAQAQVQSQARAHAHVQEAQAQAQAHAHAHARAHAQTQVQIHMAKSGALRASISGFTLRPILGLDHMGGQIQSSHGMLHLQVQTPYSGPHINYSRSLVGFGARAPQRTDFSAVRGIVGGPPCNRDRTAPGRLPNSWSPSLAVQHEILNIPAALGRAQGQGGVQVKCPVWGDPPAGAIPRALPSPLGVTSNIVPICSSSGIVRGGVVALGTPKRPGSLRMMVPINTAISRETANMRKVNIRPLCDGTWRTNGGNRGGHHNNGTLAPSSSAVWCNSLPGGPAGNKRSRENGMDQRHSLQPPSVGDGMGTRVNNLVQLGVPIAKSRVLSVSGFSENTSMAVVVEAFERQGKILDFKKDERGNAFHVTFSSVAEAVLAKRSLHRTLLNGRQITVDYTVQKY